MTVDTSVDALIGFALPLVIALINQWKWSPKVKGIVALLACVLAAVIAVALRGDLNWSDWRNTAVVVTGVALVSYHTLWKPSTVAPGLERATSVPNPQRAGTAEAAEVV
jgi:hypothetical protein